jgi:hypothetical protein
VDTLNYPATSPWSGKHEDGCVTRLPSACVVCSHGPRKHTAEAYPGAGQSFDTAGLSLIPNTGKADSLPAHTCLRRIGMLIIVPNTIETARSGPKSEGFGFVSNTRERPSGWYGARVDDTVALVMNSAPNKQAFWACSGKAWYQAGPGRPGGAQAASMRVAHKALAGIATSRRILPS